MKQRFFRTLNRWGHELSAEHACVAEDWTTGSFWLEPWYSKAKLRFLIRYGWPLHVKWKLHKWLTVLAYKLGY